MTVDRYTKAVLTVIAVCLAVLTVQSLFRISAANAQSNRQIEISGTVDVNIAKIAGTEVKTATLGGAKGALPITNGVDIIGSELPIQVKSK